MNICNSANPLLIGKILKKYSSTPNNRKKVIFSAQIKNVTWSEIHRLLRKLEFKQSVQNQKYQD